MKKDFNKWNNKKTEIDRANDRVFYHEREVWWCSTGLNVGFEQDGKGENFSRPVLIIKGFNKNVFLSVPLINFLKSKKRLFNCLNNRFFKISSLLAQGKAEAI